MSPEEQPPSSSAGGRSRLRAVRRLLRSRGVLIGELLALSAALALYTLIPQVGAAGRLAVRRFAAEYPLAAPWLHLLGLDAVLQTRWFLGLVLACAVTLSLVLEDQWARALRLCRQPLSTLAFQAAPFRTVFVRPRPPGAAVARADLRTRGRLALFGTPIFHLGLLLVLLAGLARAAFGRDAAVELIEGETLSARAEAWGRQWGGALSSELAMPVAVRFQRLRPEPSRRGGAVSRLSAELVAVEPGGPRDLRLAVNAPVGFDAVRLYLSEEYGPAVLLSSEGEGGAGSRWTVLRSVGGAKRAYEGEGSYPGGLTVRLRALAAADGALPQALEVRVLRGNGLAWVGSLRPGETIEVAPGRRLALVDVRYWAELRGARDRALWLAYLGAFLVVAGASMIFGMNKVDTAVITSPAPGGERVEVALRALRLAQLHAGEFEALVRREQGP